MAEHVTGDRVYAEQVRQLYRLSRPAYLGTLVNSSILVFALWGIVSSTLLGAWLCAMYLVTGARYLLYRAHRGANPSDEGSHRGGGGFLLVRAGPGMQRVEEWRHQNSQKLEALIDASPVSIVARDQNLRIVKWNAAAERMFGWSEREVLGGPVPFVPPDLEDEAVALRQQLLRGESITDLETVRMRKDGARVEISISTTVMRDASGQAVGVISLATAITERKHAERRMHMEHSVTRILEESRTGEEA